MKSLIRACQILKVFKDQSECLRLADVVARTGLHKTTALRMLSTLVACELLARVDETKYKLAIRPLGKHRYRFGYGMQSAEFGFSRESRIHCVAARRPRILSCWCSTTKIRRAPHCAMPIRLCVSAWIW